MNKGISLAILAGGENRRMGGTNKARIDLGGQTIIERISGAVGSLFGEIIVVTSRPGEFSGYSSIRLIADEFLNMGPLGGIHSALKSSANGTIFILACDMPLVSRELIEHQIEFFLSNDFEVVVAMSNNKIEPLHSLFDASVAGRLEDYLKTTRNPSVRDFLQICRTGYFNIRASDPRSRSFSNINTPEDLHNLRKSLGLES